MVKKKKLGEKALDWITDTAESEEVLSEQAESSKNKSAGKSKEKKIGILKHYVSVETEKKKDDTPEIPPTILGSSTTITKGKRVTPAKVEETQKTKTIEIEEEDITTKEKKMVLAEEEEKTVSGKKETEPDGKIILPEYEVKKEDVTTKEEISKLDSVYIPEDSSSIAKKRRETVSHEEIMIGEYKTLSVKKTTDPPAVKEEMPSSEKRKWKKISGICKSLKKESQKVYGSIVKTLKSDKTKVRKPVSSVINVPKKPVKVISAVDHKVTQSMKKVFLFGGLGIVGKSIVKDIKSTDTRITKSVKKLINSIID